MFWPLSDMSRWLFESLSLNLNYKARCAPKIFKLLTPKNTRKPLSDTVTVMIRIVTSLNLQTPNYKANSGQVFPTFSELLFNPPKGSLHYYTLHSVPNAECIVSTIDSHIDLLTPWDPVIIALIRTLLVRRCPLKSPVNRHLQCNESLSKWSPRALANDHREP